MKSNAGMHDAAGAGGGWSDLLAARDAVEDTRPVIEGVRDLLLDSLGGPLSLRSDAQAYCIAMLLDAEAERVRDAVGSLSACIEARRGGRAECRKCRISNAVQLGRIIVEKGATMAVCVPVRDMKSTSTFVELVERESEVTVTKNGREAMHCMSEQRYRAMQEEAAKSRLLSRMFLAQREEAAGDYADYDEFATGLKAKYGLS